ncbi:MAG: DUF3306 domain-containing protein [Rubrivivax sp.]
MRARSRAMAEPLPPPKPASAGPTLDDVARLTPGSDYAAFTAPQVDARVRNEALKKLFFSDPHFNTPDGLDVCTAADGESERSPQARQRQIQRARALGLLDDELADQDQPVPDRPVAAALVGDTAAPHEDTDLRLQPDDAAGRQVPGTGVAPGPGSGRGD